MMLRKKYTQEIFSGEISYSTQVVFREVFCEAKSRESQCEEWHNFSTYYKWRKKNYYEIEGETMHLDKDILHKKTYQYSPENCVFVPQTINSIFEKSDKTKCKNRNDLPPGVLWIKPDNIYASTCRVRWMRTEKPHSHSRIFP